MNKNQAMRPYFAECLHKEMKKNKDIYVLTSDLGYGMWDKIRKDYADRFINVGAAEQALIGISIGLALSGKIPVAYSITSFLLYRPFETIRNYVDYEKIPVKLIGSGRNKDYLKDGISHWADEDKKVMKIFKNINSYWPDNNKDVHKFIKRMLKLNKPFYINLKK